MKAKKLIFYVDIFLIKLNFINLLNYLLDSKNYSPDNSCNESVMGNKLYTVKRLNLLLVLLS